MSKLKLKQDMCLEHTTEATLSKLTFDNCSPTLLHCFAMLGQCRHALDDNESRSRRPFEAGKPIKEFDLTGVESVYS